jgi:acetyltransferase-like isoleucine patch superfamily enzyme
MNIDNITRRDNGMAYISDENVVAEMLATRKVLFEFNHTSPEKTEKLKELSYRIIGSAGKDLCITQPFYCDYGTHITVGDNFYTNYNCTILDVASVNIGNNVLFAPGVSIYTAGHPVHYKVRNAMLEYGIPVNIGNNVWIGGNTAVLPGVTIGNNTVIGAGSVVTKDIPSDVIAVGNPCRVIRKITDDDMKCYFKDRMLDQEAMSIIDFDNANN